MRKKLVPEDLQNNGEFELLTEVSHQKLREFVMKQISEEKYIIWIYSIYQIIMMLVFGYFFANGIIELIKGESQLFLGTIYGLLFSFTLLIIIHELLHALAYLLTGARKISFGLILKKFIFYAMADMQVINSKAFHVVALAPFLIVKFVCLLVILTTNDQPIMYFFLTVMCLHSLFCAGDIAMLAFYNLHRGKEIFNFDNRSEGKTYFYTLKQ
ncbi:MAG TPA: DUF3267 domain-containing protein [Prolixibacteraceae bacterium]|nr:DUF3267 domain-containing protein [Prolixibacteraceae bacterium]